MKDTTRTFFGIELSKDPTLGYFVARFANGADVVLFQTGTKAWVANLYIGPAGDGALVMKSRARSPRKALDKLEQRTNDLIRDFAAVAAKHFAKHAQSLAAVGRSGSSPRARAKSPSSRSSSSKRS